MSREILLDFETLKAFVQSYDLKSQSENADLIDNLSKQHKKYFSYLTCIAGLMALFTDKSLTPNLSSNQFDFITESCSDVGSALFVMTHGAYKSSKMMLRSSIETFLKGFSMDEIPEINKEKSVFTLFEKIKLLDFFTSNALNKKLFNSIHLDYKKLCETTHTATSLNMEHITALNYFPKFDLTEANQISEILTRLVSNYISLLCIKYNSYFHKMHHRNKENILESVRKPIKRIINGID